MAMLDVAQIRHLIQVACDMPTTFHLFGPAHLVILGAVPLLAAILAALQRRLTPGFRALRVGLATILLLDLTLYYGYMATHGQLTFPDCLPLELCDATLCLTVIALFTLNRAIFDLAYYCALAGSSMALLTPDLTQSLTFFLKVHFFVEHGVIVIAALYLVWSRQARPRPGSVGRAMIALNIFAAFVGTFNYIFKTDFMSLCAKPQSVSLLTVLGPWPWYILSCEGVAFLLFLLLYLPFRKSTSNATRIAIPK
jgi:hypothetical integral membrane protein (TIGR02206 family)